MTALPHPFDGMKATVRGSHRIAANEPRQTEPQPGDFTEADLEAIDRQYEARKTADCANFGQGIADRAARFDRPSELDMATWRRT